MSPNRIELAAGVFVLAGLAALAWVAERVAADDLPPGGTYEVSAQFSNVGGLKAGSPVLIAGVPVGRVESIALDDHLAAVVRLRVRGNLRLSTDTIASIRTSGLIGEKFLALAPGAEEGAIAPGGQIADTESAIDLESLISRFAFGNVDSAKPKGPP
jgi:phospholipid/cholesterol/gamma-HCH transport system substrate-binding protein